MNMITFASFRGVLHGGMMGPSGFQAPSGAGGVTPAPVGVVQMITLQAIGGTANP